MIGVRNISNLRYADDTVLLSEDKDELTKMVKDVKENSGIAGLDMNTSKTKVMVFSKQNGVKVSIKVDGEEIEQVDAMKYLDATLTEDGRSKTEIKIRIAKAKSSFSEMKNLLTSKELTLNLRKRLLNCYIYPIFLYGAETWTLTKAEDHFMLKLAESTPQD